MLRWLLVAALFGIGFAGGLIWTVSAHGDGPQRASHPSAESGVARANPASPNKTAEKARQDEIPRVLPGPTLDGWEVLPIEFGREQTDLQAEINAEYSLYARARHYHSPLYRFAGGKPVISARVRHGHVLRVKRVGSQNLPACSHGTWYEVPNEMYVCSADGFKVSTQKLARKALMTDPDVLQVEPFRYGKVESGTPRYLHLPSVSEQEEVAKLGADAAKLDYVQKILNGIYFIAIVGEEQSGEHTFCKTSYGRYVRADKVKELEPTSMHGEFLDENTALPVAFVFGGSSTLFHVKDGIPQKLGYAEKHARFAARGSFEYGGNTYIIGPDDIAVLRQNVRIAARIDRPKKVPTQGRWLHLNLAQQTLVAYEGDRAVMTSLLSSGIEARKTPTGLYTIDRRYITKTMSGPDDEKGWYEVGEVPWTFYYFHSYAVHGAYWHNVFGETRSHGCTNIPPADARWLFGWLKPDLPQGWYGRLEKEQSRFYFTETEVELPPVSEASDARRGTTEARLILGAKRAGTGAGPPATESHPDVATR